MEEEGDGVRGPGGEIEGGFIDWGGVEKGAEGWDVGYG